MWSGFIKGRPTDDHILTTFDVPSATLGTIAHAINDDGQIVGSFANSTGSSGQHGFLKDGDTYTTIDIPGASLVIPWGINNKGQIVGTWRESGSIDRGFLIAGGTLSTFEVPGTQFTRAQGINDAGQISGWFRAADGTGHGFIKDGDTYTIFDVPSQTFEVFGMNTDGQLVGYFQEPATGRLRGFLKDGNTFTTLAVPGSSDTFAYGINESGEIVGTFNDLASGIYHGFVATPVVMDKTPPGITISATPGTLFPPNGRLVPVTVSGTITDEPGGSGINVSSAAYVVMDEYGQVQPSGSVTLGMNGQYSFNVGLQASRRGNDANGRHYTISVSAKDLAGNMGFMSAVVVVPRS